MHLFYPTTPLLNLNFVYKHNEPLKETVGLYVYERWCVSYAMWLNLLTPDCISDAAIKKMLATLDDPFTRLLEPEKFKSLRV